MFKTTAIGNLCADPIFREVQLKTGEIVHNCQFRIAINDPYNRAKEPTYIQVTTWRGAADNCRKYLTKGRKVYVEGIIDCNPVIKDNTMYKNLQLNAQHVEFLSPRGTAAPEDIDEEEAEEEVTEEPAHAPAQPVRQPVRRTRPVMQAPAEPVDTNDLPF